MRKEKKRLTVSDIRFFLKSKDHIDTCLLEELTMLAELLEAKRNLLDILQQIDDNGGAERALPGPDGNDAWEEASETVRKCTVLAERLCQRGNEILNAPEGEIKESSPFDDMIRNETDTLIQRVQKDIIRLRQTRRGLLYQNDLMLAVREGYWGLSMRERMLLEYSIVDGFDEEEVLKKMCLNRACLRPMVRDGLQKICTYANYRLYDCEQGDFE